MKKILWVIVAILFLALFNKVNSDYLEACQKLGHSYGYCVANG